MPLRVAQAVSATAGRLNQLSKGINLDEIEDVEITDVDHVSYVNACDERGENALIDRSKCSTMIDTYSRTATASGFSG
jgi:hypothetical protein